ncbi:rod shape-determining protein MreD [Minwuia sp.]|uniref:rod shape-determining protein MreD n=1 Tax=Minwuia sp. TaxID=2493630 RepID=UPI003A93C1F9
MTGDRWHPSQLLMALPGLLTIVLVLMGTVPIGAPLLGPALPSFGLIAVFVWATHRPDLLPHWLAFGIGLTQDLVLGGPLGMNALIFLIVQGICASQRRFIAGRPFLLGWLGFAIIAVAVAIAQWVIACAYLVALVPIEASLMQATITIALFPLIAAPLMYLAIRLGREDAA